MHPTPKETKKELSKAQTPLTPHHPRKEKKDLPSFPRKKSEEKEIPRILGNSNFFHLFKKGLSGISKSAISMARHPTLTIQSMVFDGLFLMSLGAITSVFGNRIVELLLSISARVVPPASISTDQGIAAVSSAPVQTLMIHTVILITVMAIAVLILFCILEGLSYLIAYKLSGKFQEPLSFVARFSRLSARLFPAYILYEILAFTRDFRELSAERLPGLVVWDPSLLVPLLATLLSYLGLISFCFLDQREPHQPLKQTWKIGVMSIASLFPQISPLLALFMVIEYLSRILLNFGTAGSVVAILIFLISTCLIKTTLIALLNPHAHD